MLEVESGCIGVKDVDSPEVIEKCTLFGVSAVLTRADHASGSDRLAEACSLLGLDDTNASNGNKVMPVIEVLVRSHSEALEFADMKRLLEIQQKSIQIDARRLTERPSELIESIKKVDSVKSVSDELIEW